MHPSLPPPPLRDKAHWSYVYTSQFQNWHLIRIKLCTVGNLTQNEAHPVGHLTFVSKRLSAVGSKRIMISQLNFLIQHVKHIHRLLLLSIPRCNSTFFVVVVLCSYIVEYTFILFKVWSEDKLNKKFLAAENFAELVSTVAFN